MQIQILYCRETKSLKHHCHGRFCVCTFFLFHFLSAFLNIGHEEMLLSLIISFGQTTQNHPSLSMLKSIEFSEHFFVLLLLLLVFSIPFFSTSFNLHFMLLVTLILIVWFSLCVCSVFFSPVSIYLFVCWLVVDFLWLWPHLSLTSIARAIQCGPQTHLLFFYLTLVSRWL